MWATETVDLNGPRRRRAGSFVQSGRTSFFPVPVLRSSTTGRTVTFFPELNESARPASARAPSDTGVRALGERGADRSTGQRLADLEIQKLAFMIGPAGVSHGESY